MIRVAGQCQVRPGAGAALDCIDPFQMTHVILGHGVRPARDLAKQRLPPAPIRLLQLVDRDLAQLIVRQLQQLALAGSAQKHPHQHAVIRCAAGKLDAGEAAGQDAAAFPRPARQSRTRPADAPICVASIRQRHDRRAGIFDPRQSAASSASTPPSSRAADARRRRHDQRLAFDGLAGGAEPDCTATSTTVGSRARPLAQRRSSAPTRAGSRRGDRVDQARHSVARRDEQSVAGAAAFGVLSPPVSALRGGRRGSGCHSGVPFP